MAVLTWREAAVHGLAYWYLTSLVAVLAIIFGSQFLRPMFGAEVRPQSFAQHFAAWNGRFYRSIATEGYDYRPGEQSNAAFFPAYPLAARWLARATGLSIDWALVLVSQVALAAACVVLYAYARGREPAAPDAADHALLALGLCPAALFFRCAYAESLFLLLAVLAMLGLARRWPAWLCATIVGLATATRPVGVVLLAPLAMHLWARGGRPLHRVARLAWALPLGCWGLVAFMALLYAQFGDPLAFVEAQSNWHVRDPAPWGEKLIALATLEPIWDVYRPGSDIYWMTREQDVFPLFSLTFANPIFFLLAVGLTALGWRKRWLNGSETALAAGLLLVPYVLRGYDMGMAASARFTSVAFPIYLVLRHVLVRLPRAAAAVLLALSAVLLGVYSAMFGAGYLVY